jgi:small conductance mechanosensitive channel
MDYNKLVQDIVAIGTQVGFKVVGAIVLWFVGSWLIGFAVNNLIIRGMRAKGLDHTIIAYVSNAVNVILKMTLIVAILGYFGVQTTTFAALLAAAGLAIGAAWSGLLANFAAGAFLVILKPFKAGDFIQAGGIMGTVEEVGLFVTTIDTMDNIKTFVGNGKIFSDNIQNFSTNPYRRVDLVAQLDHTVDPKTAVQILKERLAKIPNVVADPAPDVEILSFTLNGPVLAVRPYCNNKDYWQVYFDTNRTIRESFGEAGFPPPQQHFQIATRPV